jgi:hypothetical protein
MTMPNRDAGDSTLLRAADRYAYRLWKNYSFCRDCLWREGMFIYSWRLPALVATPCLASPAITLLILSMMPNW